MQFIPDGDGEYSRIIVIWIMWRTDVKDTDIDKMNKDWHIKHKYKNICFRFKYLLS